MSARHGIPDEFVSDNMPFSSTAFQNFAATWGFSLVTGSPLYPKSNGQSERFVQTVKNMMRKTMEVGKEPHLALLEYRNIPLSGISYSPAQLLMCRRLKDMLPTTSNFLEPTVPQSASTRLKQRQLKQKRYYDRGTRPQKPLTIGDDVRVKLGRTWDKAIVTETHTSPRSYLVMTENGQMYHRNQSVLKPSPDPVTVVPETSDHEDLPEPEVDPPAEAPVTLRRSTYLKDYIL